MAKIAIAVIVCGLLAAVSGKLHCMTTKIVLNFEFFSKAK